MSRGARIGRSIGWVLVGPYLVIYFVAMVIVWPILCVLEGEYAASSPWTLFREMIDG